ncbi:DNA methyltransferase [Paenibacillus harenae]|uniref:DNA modification methylase n=1 Tax=Paenibacillus harenae TaxID=306543 RepID=A0ABT9U416_PAEHA|nr:DNA methyltransferase [Paenibacillus harenae]MDQ0114373.1 DNA modification methylase [Paenibacillus harenae]
MRVEQISIDALVANSWNPNEMDHQIFESLVENIKRFGVLQPLLIRSDMTIIKGEKRWKAARAAAIREVTCVIVESTEEEAKLLTVSLNHLRGRTNEELLASIVSELANHFDLEEIAAHTGFTINELNGLIETLNTEFELDTVQEDEFDVSGALSKIKEPETKFGEVWQLGRHFLMCGDSTSVDDVKKLMNGRKANLVVTDPPYNVAVESTSDVLNADGRGRIMNDDMSDEQFDDFLQKVFMNYSELMDDKSAIYVFHASSYQRAFENAMNDSGILVRTQCVWVKNAFSFGFAQYKYKHEPVFYAHLKGRAPAWYGDFKQTTVWKAGLPVESAEPASVWEVSRGDTSKYVHPTQKPLELLAIPIRNSSRKEDIVVDLFGGSGSTLMTCDQMDRLCLTMELDPVFCDVIKLRFFESTGIKPILLN